jgi:hypothetical protein
MSRSLTDISGDETPPAPVPLFVARGQEAFRWKVWELLGLALVAALLILWKHRNFHAYVADLTKYIGESSPNLYFRSTDEYFLLQGFYRAPDLWHDGLAWWHGPWIHGLTRFYRPVASYLHWAHCYIGLNWGFEWVGWMGLALFWIGCLLAAALAWRITRSRLVTFLVTVSEIVLTSGTFAVQPPGWAAWFPCHPDLLTGALMLGALLCFDLWIERGRGRFLAGAWLLFLIACGVKEHAYIFPIMALTTALLRSEKNMPLRVPRIRRAAWSLAMLAAVALLAVYRSAVVPDAGGPKLTALLNFSTLRVLLFRSVNDVYPALPLPPFSHRSPFFITALFWFAQGWAFLYVARTAAYRRFRARSLAGVAVFFGNLMLALLPALATGTLIFFADPDVGLQTLVYIVRLCILFYSLVLFVRYRKTYPTALSFLLLYLAYVPIAFATVGWHYQLIGSLFRFQFTGLFLLLTAIDLRLDERLLSPLRDYARRRPPRPVLPPPSSPLGTEAASAK